MTPQTLLHHTRNWALVSNWKLPSAVYANSGRYAGRSLRAK
jgi:hypothetical protein